MVLADVERLLTGVNITCNFSYVKAKTPSLSAIMRKQPSDMCSFFSRRHRWCFTVLCWPHAHNYKNFICHQKSPNWLWLFFLHKASFFLLLRPLWGACPQDAGVFEEWLSNTRTLTTVIVQLLSASNAESSVAHWRPSFHQWGRCRLETPKQVFLDSLSSTHMDQTVIAAHSASKSHL